MDHPQKGSAAPEFAQVWERVVEANGGQTQIQPLKPVENLCLGEGSRCHVAFLQEEIWAALQDHHTLIRLAGYGPSSQLLRSMAGDKLRQAKRLSTAAFLISGQRYFPWDQVRHMGYGSWSAGMRLMFQRFQGSESRLRRAEGETRDHCLRELFREIAREESLHAVQIRTALEMW
jgi:hypothetical protein